MTCSALTTCSPETTLLSASVLSEPHRQIGRAGEIEQRYSRGEGFAYGQGLPAHLAAPIQEHLGSAGVEQLVGGDACDHHDLLLAMEWG